MVKLYLQIILFFTLENLVFPCNVNKESIIRDTIIDPVETRISCNCEFRVDAPLNIVIYNSEITSELEGAISGIITFDTILFDSVNPLIITDFRAEWLRLKDTIINEFTFNQSLNQSMNNVKDYEMFCYYRDKLIPIIMDMKCWVDYYNYSYPPIHNRISFTFPFNVRPVNDE